MSRIENVSGTAFVVAEYRAEENHETAPMYQDPIVELFLNSDSREAADRLARGVNRLLPQLGLTGGKLYVELAALPEPAASP